MSSTEENNTGHFEKGFTNLDLVDVAFEEALESSEPKLFEEVSRWMVTHFKSFHDPVPHCVHYFKRLSFKLSTEASRKAFFLKLCEGPEFEPLYHIPNAAGHRPSFERNYQRLYASLTEAVQPTPHSNGSLPQVKVVTPELPNGYGYLTEESIRNLRLNAEGNLPTDPRHAHPVGSTHGLYFKQDPTQSLMEYAIHDFFSRLEEGLSPANELIRFEVEANGKKHIHPVLISEAIPGRSLGEILQESPVLPNLNMRRLTWLLLALVLTRPGDGHLPNHIFNDGDIVSIDNDLSFVEPVVFDFWKSIHFYSGLFLLHPGSLDPGVLKEFEGLDGDALLLEWIEGVIERERKHERLFRKEDHPTFYNKEDPDNSVLLTILFKAGTLITLKVQLLHLQAYLKEQREKEKPVTAYDLLEQLISFHDAKKRSVGPIVRLAYERAAGSSVEERLNRAVGRRNSKSLKTTDYFQKAFQGVPKWEEIEGKEAFSPEKAREELLSVLAEHCKEAFLLAKDATTGKGSLQADFGKITQAKLGANGEAVGEEKVPDETRQMLLLRALQYWAKQKQYAYITLRNCAVLDSYSLVPFLMDWVEHLDISGCPCILPKDLTLIQEKCPRLKELFLDGCLQLKTIDDQALFRRFRRGPIRFDHLQTLSLSECAELESIQITTPLLRFLLAKNTTSLLRTELITQGFPRIDIEGSSCRDVELRHLTEICTTQEDFENAERFYSSNEEVARVTVRKEPMIGWLKKGLCFGASKWKEYFGVDVVEPPLPPDIVRILASPCPFWPEKAVFETHLGPILVPAGMTLEMLEGLVQNSKKGNKIGFRHKGEVTWDQHSKTPIERTHWVLMTKNALEGTDGKGWEYAQAQLPSVRAKGYDLPSGVEAGAALFLTYVQTGERYYTDSPWTGTYCSEQVRVSGTWPMVVGDFAPAGLSVGNYDYHLHYYYYYSFYGLGCLRKFF